MTGSNLIRYGFNAAKLFRLTQQQSQFIAVRSCKFFLFGFDFLRKR